MIGSQHCMTCELHSNGCRRERISKISTQVAPLAVSGNVISKATPLYLPLQRKRKMCEELLKNSVRVSVASHWSLGAAFDEARSGCETVLVCAAADTLVHPVCVFVCLFVFVSSLDVQLLPYCCGCHTGPYLQLSYL